VFQRTIHRDTVTGDSFLTLFFLFAAHSLIGKAVFKRLLPPTVSFLPCRIEGPLFDTGFSFSAPSAATRGWHQVARHMHNHNVIIGARSASQLAPDSVAALGNECLCSSASLSSHCNQKYTMRSNIFVLYRTLPPGQSGT
jgi:hypothetical protein